MLATGLVMSGTCEQGRPKLGNKAAAFFKLHFERTNPESGLNESVSPRYIACFIVLESAHALPERSFPRIETIFAKSEIIIRGFLIFGK